MSCKGTIRICYGIIVRRSNKMDCRSLDSFAGSFIKQLSGYPNPGKLFGLRIDQD
jgi:hypothetical protein